jgi:hypothetical protein
VEHGQGGCLRREWWDVGEVGSSARARAYVDDYIFNRVV